MLAWLVSCSVCGNCLKACPLYQGELDTLAGVSRLSDREHTGLGELVHTSRWLASCSGCGMCEENCNRDVSLTLFLSALSHRIREELHYTPGSPGQRYPWVGR
jgi:Fe-S oxidoreductase